MRYNSVDDAIADYKKAYGLMWDTRSIIVKFRRKEGNAYLPEELKPDVKKVKEETSNVAQVEKERNVNHIELKLNVNKSKEEGIITSQEDKVIYADKSSMNQNMNCMETQLQDDSIKSQNKSTLQVQENTNSRSSLVSTLITSNKTIQVEKEWNVNHIKSNVELKPNVNKSKEEKNSTDQEDKVNYADKSLANQDTNSVEERLQDNSIKAQNKSALQENTNSHSSLISTSITSDKTIQEQQGQFWVINIKLIIMLYVVIIKIE